MSLFKIAWRSIQQRALASWLTGLSMALGVALVVIVLVIYGLVSRSFSDAAQGYHLIVGKKGSSLQLVFNTVFHLSRPIENLPWSYYKELTTGKHGGVIDVAVPLCLGDSYKDFRVVGTTPDLFEKLSYGSFDNGDPKMYRCAEGRFFGRGEKDYFTAVIGSVAARQAGLQVGAKFSVTHGLADDAASHSHEEPFEVVGVLEPTGTPNDRAIFINIEGFFLISGHAGGEPEEADHHEKPDDKHAADTQSAVQSTGAAAKHDEYDKTKEDAKPAGSTAKPNVAKHDEHDHDHHHQGHEHQEPLPENQREVTSILLLLKHDAFAQDLYRVINKGNVAQAVFPSSEVLKLMEGMVGTVRWLFLILAGLVVVVAGIGVMVSIYNSMNDRRRDIAIMRSLGAGRVTVMFVVLLESIMLSVLGGLAGVLLAHLAIGALSNVIVGQTGVSVSMFQFEKIELVVIPGLVVLASLVGYLPALTAYRTDVAKALSAAP